jgi:hypothetical protein
MTGHITAWECIGCGRIEGVQPCVGICQDRRVDFVYADEHATVLAQLQRMTALVQQLAWTHPHNGEWEKSFRALQERALRMLATAHGVAAAAVE